MKFEIAGPTRFLPDGSGGLAHFGKTDISENIKNRMITVFPKCAGPPDQSSKNLVGPAISNFMPDQRTGN